MRVAAPQSLRQLLEAAVHVKTYRLKFFPNKPVVTSIKKEV